VLGIIEGMRYAVWVTHIDGRSDRESPRLVVTNGPLHFGDKLPLANVACWITEVIEGEWTDEAGQVYDARAFAAAGPSRDADAN
jgi:hypothetical protein